jgi:hypothetical protein
MCHRKRQLHDEQRALAARSRTHPAHSRLARFSTRARTRRSLESKIQVRDASDSEIQNPFMLSSWNPASSRRM